MKNAKKSKYVSEYISKYLHLCPYVYIYINIYIFEYLLGTKSKITTMDCEIYSICRIKYKDTKNMSLIIWSKLLLDSYTVYKVVDYF